MRWLRRDLVARLAEAADVDVPAMETRMAALRHETPPTRPMMRHCFRCDVGWAGDILCWNCGRPTPTYLDAMTRFLGET